MAASELSTPTTHGRTASWPVAAAAMAALAFLCACQPPGAGAPRHYLAITHSALNRLTFFDLDTRRVVGALPAQKLPHDLLLSPDQKRLFVLNSGAQCVTTYHLDSPDLWSRARAFMRRDTTRAQARGPAMAAPQGSMGPEAGGNAPPGPHPASPRGSGSTEGSEPVLAGAKRESATAQAELAIAAAGRGPIFLNPDPVQRLPASVAEFHLTDPLFPDTVREIHSRVRATEHHACFDCHARSRGGKPFGPVYSRDRASIYLVHLAYRNITVLDAATLAVRRQLPLDLPANVSPVEVWIEPGTRRAFVTCRDEIGQSRPGRILVVDLDTGATLKTIPAGIYPWHMVPDSSGRRLFVNNFQSSRISIVDVARQEIVDSLVVQNGPSMMVLGPGAKLFVSCFYTDRLLVVDLPTRSVEKVIPVGGNPTSLLLSADRRQIYVLCGGESALVLVDFAASRVLARYPLLFGAYAFQLVDRDLSGRWIAASGPVVQGPRTPGDLP